MVIWLLLCALAPLLSGCAGPQKRQYEFYDAFDTVIRLTAYTRDEASFRRLCEQAEAEFLRYDAIFDRYEAHEGVQGVWALNHAQGEATPVEPELLELLLLAQEWYAVCDRVNVAMGAVTDIWHAARESGALPSQEALEAAAAHTDFSLVEVDAAAGTVRLRDPALSLDFGALAKGYAAERIAQALGEETLLIDAGGNVVAAGKPGDGRAAWDIAVSHPDGGVLCVVPVADGCAVTSGGSQRYFTVDGVRYHHIIDKDTLYPSTLFTSVTVVTKNSGLADALSTALFCMPLADGEALCEKLGDVEALWVLPDGELHMTSGMEAILVPDDTSGESQS